jgi:hypothetical protein
MFLSPPRPITYVDPLLLSYYRLQKYFNIAYGELAKHQLEPIDIVILGGDPAGLNGALVLSRTR